MYEICQEDRRCVRHDNKTLNLCNIPREDRRGMRHYNKTYGVRTLQEDRSGMIETQQEDKPGMRPDKKTGEV